MQKEEYKKHLSRMQALCSRGEKCRADISLKLEQAGVPREETEEILKELEKERFLDQERYATAYARDKSSFQGWGPRKIHNMLKIKEIPEEIIEKSLSGLGENWFREKLAEALCKKQMHLKDKDPRKRYAALVRFGLGRGYSYSQIVECLGKITKAANQ
ncbi:MAG: RecX family transcriptional regulator [Bacteroidales bacterium]|nr:RecX family transcriptional regulator [Bacteroidales bacterium]MDD3521700.1 RecX family transcriptional regulator [Bacteroidales bacterium]MDD4030230.1 RecX family transcriptional regulator [Bacteroidales bacterium]MDD4436053.1 RecX family transcriptional regulator [Bacteroidales bacterium]MDD5732513.1 RecX family transcriptional regulator [Bacteroidales bacterium]